MCCQPSAPYRNVDLLDFLEPAAAWRDQAACIGDDTERFFPAGSTGGEAAGHIAEAKEVCASCKARQQCLDYALDKGQHDGIWGGLTEDERRTLRRKRHRRATPGSHRPSDQKRRSSSDSRPRSSS